MKKMIFLFLLIFLVSNSYCQNIIVDSLADKLFNAFKAKDFNSYRKFLINTEDEEEFMQSFFKKNHISPKRQKKYLEDRKLRVDSTEKEYRQDFDRLISKGEKLGIKWGNIKNGEFIFITDSPNSFVAGHLNFTSSDTSFVLFDMGIEKLSSGYRLLSIKTVAKMKIDKFEGSYRLGIND